MEAMLQLVDVQLLFTLFLVALLWSFQARLRKQDFFRWWAWAWTAFAVHLASGAGSLRLGPEWSWLKAGLLLVTVVAGALEIPLLIFGAWSAHSSGKLPRKWLRLGTGAAIAAAGLSFAAALWFRQQFVTSFAARTAPREMGLAGAFFYCAAVFLGRWRKERSWAALTTGGFCLAYAIAQAFYSLAFLDRLIADLVMPAWQLVDLSNAWRTRLLFFDLVCNAGICLGLVLLLLEEHQRTEHDLVECNLRGQEMAVSNTALQAEISERIRLQQALQESEAKFRSLTEMVACGIWIHDGSHFLYFNPPVEAVTGYSRQELLSMEVWQLVHPECREMVRQRAAARGRGGSVPARYEFKIITRAGEERWLDFTAKPIEFEGRPVILGTAFDITERRWMERALKTSEETFSKIFQASPNILTLTSASELRCLKVNEAFERATGYTNEEVTGRTWQEVGLSVDALSCEELRQRIKGQGGIRNAEWHFRDKRGNLHIGLLSSESVQVPGERCYLTAVVDITDLKRAEEKAHEASQLYRELFNSTEDGIIISTPEGRVLDANPAASRILGYNRDEIMALGRKNLLDKSDPVRAREFLKRRARTGAADSELTVVRKDGTRILAEGFSHIFHDQRGQARTTVVFRDITARKRAEEALSSVSRRLIAAQEQERTRIARELHDDINQRIALLAIELERLRQESYSSEEMRRQLQEVSRLTAEIGTDIQAISHRLHSSKLEYLGLVAASSSFCRETSEQHRVKVNFIHDNIPEVLPWEIALCLFRVLQEALSNAVKHSGVRNFEVELRGARDKIHLKVRDAGIGFDPQAHADGEGIGLASMRERVGLVSGTLLINSRPGGGTLIEAHVPVGNGTAEAEAGRLSA